MEYISPHKIMVILVMFDLPTGTKKQKKAYSIFRKHLLKSGFEMLQYSIYYRYCIGRYTTNKYKKTTKKYAPNKSSGSIRIIEITSKQFENMEILYSKDKEGQEKKINKEQLLLF